MRAGDSNEQRQVVRRRQQHISSSACGLQQLSSLFFPPPGYSVQLQVLTASLQLVPRGESTQPAAAHPHWRGQDWGLLRATPQRAWMVSYPFQSSMRLSLWTMMYTNQGGGLAKLELRNGVGRQRAKNFENSCSASLR